MSELAYVKLSQLQLWTENPRTGSVENGKEAIIKLVRKQQTSSGNKLVELAKSIVEYGIYEPIGILKYNDGFMVVKEGNRRVTCLKLLNNPNLLPDEFSLLRNLFKELKKNTNKGLFDNIPARIFNEDENEELETWIELRHSGLQGGKGINSWGAVEKENWRKYRGKNTPLLDFQKYLIDNKILAREQVDSVSKTNWERILGTVGRRFLGLKYEDGQYIVVIDQKDFNNRIRVTIENLKGRSVGVVYDNDAITEFFNDLDFSDDYEEIEVEKELVLEVNDGVDLQQELEEKCDSEQMDMDSLKNANSEINEELKTDDKDETKNRYSSKPADFMENIVCDLESSQDTDGIIRLSIELKNMSKTKHYKEYPIAAAMLMRNLLEQCLIYYLKKRNKWRKFYNSKRHDPTLSEIIQKYISDTDIFQQDRELGRIFNVLTKTAGIKDYFDLIVHHPHKIGATPDYLDSIAKSGYLALVQHIIDY